MPSRAFQLPGQGGGFAPVQNGLARFRRDGPRGQQDAIRVQFEDLTRLEAAYSRTRPSSDDTAYLERRIGELEVQARIRR